MMYIGILLLSLLITLLINSFLDILKAWGFSFMSVSDQVGKDWISSHISGLLPAKSVKNLELARTII